MHTANAFGLSLSLSLVSTAILLTQTPTFAQKSCQTPIRQPGFCVPYTDCEFVTQQYAIYGANIPAALQRFLQRSLCQGDGDGIHLCCAEHFVKRVAETATIQTLTIRPNNDDSLTPSTDIYTTMNARGLEILEQVPKCGSLHNQRVSHGEATKIAEFPWMALLKYDTNYQPYKCGGSLITERFVLTAAHCVLGIHDRLVGVRLGEYNLNEEQDCQYKGRRKDCLPPVEDFSITEIKTHPLYKQSEIYNDIALLKLDRQVQFKRHIKPVCLPITSQSRQITTDQRYYIAGWGTTEHGETSPVLLKAVVEHKSLDVCRSIFRQVALTDVHLCAGGDGPHDSCKGDSGGPLFFVAPYKEAPRYVQFGIVSFGGAKCGMEKAYPGIYANVTNLLPWITHSIN